MSSDGTENNVQVTKQEEFDWYSGKVLVIDENFQQVKDFIAGLAEKKIPVQYWNGEGNLPSHINNVRFVTLDLDITGSGLPRTNEADYYPAAEALSKIAGPYLLLILSTNFVPDDAGNLKSAYENLIHRPLSGFVDGNTGIKKSATPEELYTKIKDMLEKEKVFRIILTWEKILDRARDEALNNFVTDGIQKELLRFIKTLEVDFGKNSIGREFIASMMKFVYRYMNKGPDFDKLSKILQELDLGSLSNSSDMLLSNLKMYHVPDSAEPLWTGDILKLKTTVETEIKFERYAIVLTPVCDFSQQNLDRVTICEGFPLDKENLQKDDHPIHIFAKDFVLPDKETVQEPEYSAKLQKSLRSLSYLPNRLYPLWNFTEDKTNFFGILFNFQKIKTVDGATIIDNYERMSRLDSPFIEAILQSYAEQSTRLGIPSINFPHIDGQKMNIKEK